MSKLRVLCFSTSLDGYGAGPSQSLENPLGIDGRLLHEWAFATKFFQEKLTGKSEGSTGIDNDFVERGFQNIGAWILGRNMFAPIRGPWKDESWKGWWGNNPPYHVPVFIVTHHPRKPIVMEGGTTFYFVTDGIESALRQAKEQAKGKDIRLGGGVSLIKQYFKAKLIDEMHIAVSPVILGSGEHLFSGIDLKMLGYKCVEQVQSGKVTHYVIRRNK